MNYKLVKKIAKIAIPVAIGSYLMYYFINGLTLKDYQQIKVALRQANYTWVLIGLIVVFLSHLSRAKRWLFLARPLGYKIKLLDSYNYLMIGYLINYTIPRSGELARTGYISKYEKIPYEQGLATIIIERFLDLIMLFIVTLITGWLQVNEAGFNHIIVQEEKGWQTWPIIVAVFLIVLCLILLVLYKKNEKIRLFLNKKKNNIIEVFSSIRHMKNRLAFFCHTLFIWICYVAGIWVFAQVFSETENISIGCIFGLFTVGTAALVIFPGGLGGYPLWLTNTLLLYQIDFPIFGLFVWIIITSFMVISGFISLISVQMKSRNINIVS